MQYFYMKYFNKIVAGISIYVKHTRDLKLVMLRSVHRLRSVGQEIREAFSEARIEACIALDH